MRKKIYIAAAGVMMLLCRAGAAPAPTQVSPQPSTSASPGLPVAAKPASTSPSDKGSDPSFAFVDMNKIFNDDQKTKEAEAKIKQAREAAKKEYDQRSGPYKAAVDEVNALVKKIESPQTSEAAKTQMTTERDSKITALKKMEADINSFGAARDKELQDQANKMRNDIVADITSSIRRLTGESANAILDVGARSANGILICLFSPRAGHITDQVTADLKGQPPPVRVEPVRDVKIALVNINDVFKRFWKAKQEEAKIEAAKAAAGKEDDEKTSTYKKMSEEVDASAGGDRDQKIAKLKDLEREITEFRTKRGNELQDQVRKSHDAIVTEVMRTIGSIPVSDAKILVFDSSAKSINGVPVILFSKEIPDFTEELVTTLNATSGQSKLAPQFASSKTLRLGCADVNRVFQQDPETKQTEIEINDKKNTAQKEYDSRADAYKKSLQEINEMNRQIDSAKSAESRMQLVRDRDHKITALKEMERTINQFRQTGEKDLQGLAMKKRDAIVAKITRGVQELGEKEKFNIVFDTNGNSLNGVPFLVSSHDLPDLTDEVISHSSPPSK